MLEIQEDGLIIPDYGLVYFYNDYSEDCKIMNKTLDSLSSKEHNVIKVDTEEQNVMVEYYGVEKIPCLVAVSERKVVEKKYGLLSDEKVKELLKKSSEY